MSLTLILRDSNAVIIAGPNDCIGEPGKVVLAVAPAKGQGCGAHLTPGEARTVARKLIRFAELASRRRHPGA